MPDLAISLDATTGVYDLSLTADGSDLATEEGLFTSVALSLLLDRQATVSDTLPYKGDKDRRGWFADEFNGFNIGSRRWIFLPQGVTQVAMRQIEAADKESLQWMLDDGVAQSVGVTVTQTGPESFDEEIVITHPSAGGIQVNRWTVNWAAQGVILGVNGG